MAAGATTVRLRLAALPARRFLLTALTLLAVIGWVSSTTAFETTPLSIETEAGRHDFTVEIATDPQERARGLMFRDALPADRGMLFDYRRPQIVTMWMKNTLIPLDMIFIGGDGLIRRIVERTVPLSLETISSREPVRAVLELSGGSADRLDIRVGDRVFHALFERD